MEKRVVIFLVLSLAVILGYDLLLKQFGLLPPPATVEEPPEEATGTRNGDLNSPPAGPGGAPPGSPAPPDQAVPSGRPASQHVQSPAQTVMIETDLVRVGLDARGGVISSWELKRHHTGLPDENPVQLVHQEAKFKGPLSITTTEPTADKALREGQYAIETDFTSLDHAHPVGHATLRYQDGDSKLKVVKQLTFHHGSYLVDVAMTVEGLTGGYDVVLGTNFGIVEWGDGFIGLIGSASLVNGTVEKESPETEIERKGAVQWVALQDKYFLSVLMPQKA
jgi:YidC/Oxa1 family membrane protein insertase